MKKQRTTDPIAIGLRHSLESHALLGEVRFIRYVRRLLLETSLFLHLKRLLEWMRRVRLFSLVLRVLTMLLAILQAGATLLLTTLLLLIALPLLLCWLSGMLLAALLESKQSNRILQKKTEGRRVYVLFEGHTSGAFFYANARELSMRENAFVIIVSPFWLSSKGILKKQFYCTSREESETLYTVRRFYFFSLKRKVLKDRDTAFLF